MVRMVWVRSASLTTCSWDRMNHCSLTARWCCTQGQVLSAGDDSADISGSAYFLSNGFPCVLMRHG